MIVWFLPLVEIHSDFDDFGSMIWVKPYIVLETSTTMPLFRVFKIFDNWCLKLLLNCCKLFVTVMDACRASSCCRGARNVPWTEVPWVRGTRLVPGLEAVVASAEALRVPGAHRRRWRSWILSPQRRPTRQNIPWTKEPLPPSTTNLNISNTGFPHTGKKCPFLF